MKTFVRAALLALVLGGFLTASAGARSRRASGRLPATFLYNLWWRRCAWFELYG